MRAARGVAGQLVHAVFQLIVDAALKDIGELVGRGPVIFHDLNEEHLGQAVAAQGRHGDSLAGLRQAHAAIGLMDQISTFIEALDHC